MNIFQSTLRGFIATSLTLMLASTIQGNAQTNIPTEDSVVQGTFNVKSTSVVKGADAASSYLATAVTVAATVRQVIGGTPVTNSSGVVTRKESFKRYAFGNKEILQLSLGTNKTTGYALSYTNAFANNPLDSGAFVARSRTNLVPVNSVAFNYVDEISTLDERRLPGFIYTKYNESGFIDLTVNLGSFSNVPASGNFNRVYPKKVVFGTGTNKVTNDYTGMTANGRFSGIVRP